MSTFSEKWLYIRIIKTYYTIYYTTEALAACQSFYSYMFADFGLADMIWEKGGVVERMGVGLIHWTSIVVGVVFKSFFTINLKSSENGNVSRKKTQRNNYNGPIWLMHPIL